MARTHYLAREVPYGVDVPYGEPCPQPGCGVLWHHKHNRTSAEYWELYHTARERAKRVQCMIRERADRIARQAGLGDARACHNAMAAAHYGKPWPNVDYRLVRYADRLLRKEWDASHLVHNWDQRNRVP